jgi:serine/threonine-protein kinase RsbW
VIEQLADELRVAPEGGREYLFVRLEYAGTA